MRYLQRKGICIMIITRIVLNEADLDRRVKAVARKLAPDVVRIRYDIALDSTDKEAIYFRILLSDDASREERLGEVAARVESELSKKLKLDDLGLSIHAPLLPATRGMMNAVAFAKMKKGAYLVNTGRGPLLDEPALIAALDAGQ